MPAAHIFETSNEIKADDRVIHAPSPAVSHPALRPPWSVWPLAGTTVGLMAVSLTHLSDGVTQLTAIRSWQSWCMAAGIDCLLISVALAQLTSPPDVKRDIAIVARCLEAGTLVMSAGLNALAFTRWGVRCRSLGAGGLRLLRTGTISGATYILARLTRR